MIDGQTLLNIRETNSYQSEEIRSMKDRIRLLETQEFPFVRIRDFDAKGDLLVGTADNTFDQLAVGLTNGFVLQVDSTAATGVKWATVPTAGIADLSVTTAKLADNAVTTVKIADANVTNAKLANMVEATVKGRALAAGTGVPVDLTATQLNAIVGSADLTLAGQFTSTGASAGILLHDRATNAASISLYSPSAGQFRVYSLASSLDLQIIDTSYGTIFIAPTSETALGYDNARLGVVSGSPRLILEDSGNTQAEIDNSAGTMRFLSPGVVRATLDTGGNLATTGAVTASAAITTKGAAGGLILWNRTGTSAPSGEWYSPSAGDVRLYNYALVADQIIAAASGLVTMGYNFAVSGSTALARGSATDGALKVAGTTYASHFNYSTGEDTYIRGGKSTSDVYVGDAGSGDVILGQAGAGMVTAAGDMTVGDDLYVTDTLAVGVATPDTKAHIHASSAGSVSAIADSVLTLESSGDTHLQLLSGNGNVQRIVFGDTADNDINQFYCIHIANDFIWRLDNSSRIQLSSSDNSLQPADDIGQSLGTSSFRWNEVWAFDGSINTSDEREKRNIKPSDLGLDFITRLNPISWVWADKPAYEVDDIDDDKPVRRTVPARTFRRPHYGLSAQQVRKALDDLGVEDFAGYIYDAESDVYALRYNEFITPLIMAVQELSEQIKELKDGSKKTN